MQMKPINLIFAVIVITVIYWLFVGIFNPIQPQSAEDLWRDNAVDSARFR